MFDNIIYILYFKNLSWLLLCAIIIGLDIFSQIFEIFNFVWPNKICHIQLLNQFWILKGWGRHGYEFFFYDYCSFPRKEKIKLQEKIFTGVGFVVLGSNWGVQLNMKHLLILLVWRWPWSSRRIVEMGEDFVIKMRYQKWTSWDETE